MLISVISYKLDKTRGTDADKNCHSIIINIIINIVL